MHARVEMSVQITDDQCKVIAQQIKALSLRSVTIATTKYRVFYHSPMALLVGQVRNHDRTILKLQRQHVLWEWGGGRGGGNHPARTQ